MKPKHPGLLKTILWVGLLVGFLDISTAFIYYYINTHKDPQRVLFYIASAVFGKDAYTSPGMGFIGGLFHFIVAYSFTIVFFLIYPRFKLLAKNRLLTGIFYGLFIWAVMNLGVVPVTKIGKFPSDFKNSVINMLILIVVIGIPLSYLAYWFYYKRKPAGL